MPREMAPLNYRADIDGLRAISIIAVVLFHAFPQVAPRGYLGVDVFFVISGYLISIIIFQGIGRERFFANFYTHRVRRLFPSLITVLLAVVASGWFVLLADEFRALSEHLVKAGLFILNIKLYKEDGYFEPANELKPIMHLWSLSVEEQFYLLFPVAIMVGNRLKLKPIILIGLAFCVSATACVLDKSAERAFFSLHARIWEFSVGAAIAYHNLYAIKRGWRQQADVISISGIFLLVGVIVVDKWPVTGTVIPTLIAVSGAGLMILSGAQAVINRSFLSTRPLVFLGKVSYPLYLVHWPILSYMLIIQGEPPAPEMRIVGVGMSLMIAYLIYRYIETPLRQRRNNVDIAIMAIVMMLIVAAGAYINQRDGLPGRKIHDEYSANLPDSNHKEFFTFIASNFAECSDPEIREATESHLGIKRCAQTYKDKEPEVVIIGDSHGEHLFIGLAQALGNTGVGYYSFRCLPFFGVTGHSQCEPMDRILHRVRESSVVKIVVLAASWPGKIRTEAGLRLAANLDMRDTNLLREGLDGTVRALVGAGKKVMIIGDSPTFPFQPVKCIAPRPFSIGREPICTINVKQYLSEHQKSWNVIEQVISKYKHTVFYSQETLFCNDIECSMQKEGKLMFRDNDHLSKDGSVIVGGAIALEIIRLGWIE
jgi:peptidoglycan/LPS O-acetylase OafA/YrhL